MKRFAVAFVVLFALAGCTAAQRLALAHSHQSRPAITQATTSNSVDIPRVVEPDAGPSTVTQNGVTITANCTSIRFTATGYVGSGLVGLDVGNNAPYIIHMIDGGFDNTTPMTKDDRTGALYYGVQINGVPVAHGQVGTGC